MNANRPQISDVLETVLYFSDQDRTEQFYGDILGLRLLDKEPGRSLFYRAGPSLVLLFNAERSMQPRSGRLPPHGASGSIHVCFRVAGAEYAAWKDHMRKSGVPILKEVSWARGLSFYFHDPDDNLLEIANADIWPA